MVKKPISPLRRVLVRKLTEDAIALGTTCNLTDAPCWLVLFRRSGEDDGEAATGVGARITRRCFPV